MAAVKMRLGVPHWLGSCHTGVIDGEFVEGHVPADDILKLRAQRDLIGAAVPGMPMGSPGMARRRSGSAGSALASAVASRRAATPYQAGRL